MSHSSGNARTGTDVRNDGSVFRSALAALALAVFSVAGPPPAAAQDVTDPNRAAMEKVVRDYILEHPEIIVEAIEKLRERKRLAEINADRETLVANTADIYRDKTSPVGGNPDGDVTVVEFFDYRCGVCRQVHPIVNQLIEGDPKIRRVYKEWPILGPESVVAARAAIAAHKQGRYLPFHNALMEARSNVTEATVLRIASSVGLDVARLQMDMQSPETGAIIQKNYALAQSLKLNGTPSFLIGDRIIRGGQDLESMRALVAQARARK